MNYIRIIIILIFLIINLNAKKLEKVSLQLDWLHQFQFAGYYMAKEKGFYKDYGLDVKIKEFDFGINLLDKVLSSKSTYAVGKSSLIIDKLNGKDIILLAAIYQNSPMVLISLDETKINSPIKLKNKKVMLTSDARSAASINSMLISQGVKLENIKFQEHSFKLEDLINKKTDAMGCYLSNEPYELDKRGIKYHIHNPSDYGFDFYGGILFTSTKELKENPVRTRKMYNATIKGWQYAFNNIEETAKIIFSKYNTQNKTLKSLIYEGKILKKLSKIDEGLLGNISEKKIQEIKRLYLLLSLANNNLNINIKDIIYNPYKISHSMDEKNYLLNNKITLISNNNFPPFTIKEGIKVKGIEIDYWNLINKKLGITKSNIAIDNEISSAIKKIQNNINNLKYTFSEKDLKKDNLIVSDTIAKINIAIATLNNIPHFFDAKELNGKKIAIEKYSTLYPLLKKHYSKFNFVEVKNQKEGINKLYKGEVYGFIGKLPALAYDISQNHQNKIKIAGVLKEKFHMKLSINSQNKNLLKLINTAISTISDEERNKINTKYYSVIYQKQMDYSWTYKIAIPLLIIIIFVIINNRKLNNEITKRTEIEKELNIVANLDSLTKIYNRRKIETIFNSELERARRYNRTLSVIFFDVDNFKFINDNLGHSSGDDVLIKLSSIIKNNIRSIDYFGRWGGEEFIIILPETKKEQASNLAYILKDKIYSNDFLIGRKVSCSFGVSQYEETDSADSLLTRADNAMYYVKRNGKNEVKVV